jgi:uncharacterized membrane protein YoaK (UPF0700 family)
VEKQNTLSARATMSMLGYISGFVDTLGFIALFALFPAHITGNFVLIAASFVDYRHGLLLKALAIPVFILAAIATRLYMIRHERRSRDPSAHILIAEAALLTLFMAVALAATPFANQDSPATIATGLLAATAMAVQNTAARTSLGGLPPTTVMTGNLMQIIVDLLDVVHGHGAVEAKRARLANLVSLMLSFSAGAITGAIGYLTIGFLALLAPIAAALTLGLFARPHPATVA